MAPASTAAKVLATAQPVSLWQWIPSGTPISAASLTTSPTQVGMPPLVSQRTTTSARFGGRPDRFEGIRPVTPETVEEVLAVHKHTLPFGTQVGDRIGDHVEVLAQRRPQGLLDVSIMAFGDDAGHGRPRIAEGGERIIGRCGADPPGEAEGHKLGVAEPQLALCHRGEKGGVTRIRTRPATFDEPDPSSSSSAAMASLSPTERPVPPAASRRAGSCRRRGIRPASALAGRAFWSLGCVGLVS